MNWIKNLNGIIAVSAVLVLLNGCDTTGEVKKSAEKSALGDDYGVLMTYSERERAGTALFNSIMYVNKNYIYFSDDRSPEDFLLFNRQNQTIYSVVHANKSVFVIRKKDITGEPPIPVAYTVESQPSSAIPKVEGRVATHYRYMANGTQCYDAVTLEKDFLTEVVAAIKEYRSVLAGEHASTVHKMPADTHEACDLALNIYHATEHLDTGLPMREWDQNGYLKFMVNYKLNYKMDPAKFQIPADYNEFSVGQ